MINGHATAQEATIVVLNPNSNRQMTAAIAIAAAAATHPGVQPVVRQLDDGPPVIETDEQLDLARRLVSGIAASMAGRVLVVACHGDPGVRQARRPGLLVVGIGEASMMAAAASGGRFAVLSLTESTAARKWDQIRSYGLASRCVSVESTGPAEALTCDAAVDPSPYVVAAQRAVRAGAGAVVLGCAGMARIAKEVQAALDVPVLEPVSVTCQLASMLTLCRPAHREGALFG